MKIRAHLHILGKNKIKSCFLEKDLYFSTKYRSGFTKENY